MDSEPDFLSPGTAQQEQNRTAVHLEKVECSNVLLSGDRKHRSLTSGIIIILTDLKAQKHRELKMEENVSRLADGHDSYYTVLCVYSGYMQEA